MAVREYIGARYVPIFGRKGEESIEWDNSNSYEPLTIVLHQGNSYTSRQYVPTGIDIANENYWALTGNYNAQVESYRAEVRAYDSRIVANENAIAAEQAARESAITAEQTAREMADTTINQVISDIDEVLTSTYTSLDEAKAAVTADETFVRTLEYHTGTGIGGAYYLVSEIAPNTYYETAESGVYLQLVGADSVSQFGAIGNGVADDTESVQNAIDSLGVINFEAGANYRISNILINESNKILNGNKATLRSDAYTTGELLAPIYVGSTSVKVSNPNDFHVNQTAIVYNATSSPTEYQIVITGINGDTIEFASYKPFRQSDTIGDSSPYQFPTGSTIYTGTTILSIMPGMNVNSSGTVANVTVDNFIFAQPTSIASAAEHWGQLAYGVIAYYTENVTFSNNHVTSINELFLMFYGYHKNALVRNNIFEGATSSYAVCAHWDMQNVSLNNRTHNFNVIDNVFRTCHYNIIYSSVDGGLCQGNQIINSVFLTQGIYIYGGDIGIHTAYSSYDQESFWTNNITVSNNLITAEGRKAGTGIQFLGAYNCKACDNMIFECVVGINTSACNNIDISGNTIEYTYISGSVDNCSIRCWGMARNLYIHENMFNTPRIMRLDQHFRTVSTGVISTTEYYGFTDSEIYIENNKIKQADHTTVIWVDGHTEKSTAPSILVDVPKRIMFNRNTLITNSTSGTTTIFQINSTLANFVTDVSNLKVGQMCVIGNISQGLTPIMQKFLDVVTNEGNIVVPY